MKLHRYTADVFDVNGGGNAYVKHAAGTAYPITEDTTRDVARGIAYEIDAPDTPEDAQAAADKAQRAAETAQAKATIAQRAAEEAQARAAAVAAQAAQEATTEVTTEPAPEVVPEQAPAADAAAPAPQGPPAA